MIAELELQGWLIAYSDGSAEKHPSVGWEVGFGYTIPGEWDHHPHLQVDSPQTNNRAELSAIICIIEHK